MTVIPIVLVLAAAAADVPARAADRRLTLMRRELGDLSAKSIVAAPQAGRVFAQNMIYNHSVTVFDLEGNRIADISDRVPRALLGLDGAGFVRGAPVEGAIAPDGKSLFVSNYYLLGKGFPGNVKDTCKPGEHAPSFVFQIDVEKLEVVRGFAVGAAPKFLAVTRDGAKLLVSNWCDFTLSVIDLRSGGTRHIKIGSYPRGIAIEPDGKTAYVTTMGRRGIAVVDIERLEVVRWLKGGRGPRHLLLGPEGKLYVSLSHESSVAVVDKASGDIVARARTGKDPRSMALSSDGSALYVANYREDSLAVIDTATMKVMQKIATGPFPIGVAFEPTHERVWVSCYGGSVRIYDTRGAPIHKSVAMLRDEAKRFPR
jgi:YVTN family beta-propeller protein